VNSLHIIAHGIEDKGSVIGICVFFPDPGFSIADTARFAIFFKKKRSIYRQQNVRWKRKEVLIGLPFFKIPG